MAKRLKILVVRFSSIGDIVLTTPVVRCLHLQLNAEVHYLTKASFVSILKTNPYLSKVWSIRSKVAEVRAGLQAEEFDYVIDLHKNLRTLQLRLMLRSSFLAFQKLNLEKWLMTKLKMNRLPKTHIVDRYLETVKPFGVNNDGQGLDYFIPQNAKVAIEDYRQNGEKIIAFAIGAAHATKRLPTEKIISICHKIIESSPAIIILLGGKDDAARGKIIAQSIEQKIINYCGKLNLSQSASVLQQADIVITHDTGLMHIAAAFDKQIVSVWGNTIPDFGMYPYVDASKFAIVEVQGLSCRPCSKIGHSACPKRHFKCMNQIDESLILDEVKASAQYH